MSYYIVFIIIWAFVAFYACERFFGKNAYIAPNFVSTLLEQKFMSEERDKINGAALWRLCGFITLARVMLLGIFFAGIVNRAMMLAIPIGAVYLALHLAYRPLVLLGASSRKYFRKK